MFTGHIDHSISISIIGTSASLRSLNLFHFFSHYKTSLYGDGETKISEMISIGELKFDTTIIMTYGNSGRNYLSFREQLWTADIFLMLFDANDYKSFAAISHIIHDHKYPSNLFRNHIKPIMMERKVTVALIGLYNKKKPMVSKSLVLNFAISNSILGYFLLPKEKTFTNKLIPLLKQVISNHLCLFSVENQGFGFTSINHIYALRYNAWLNTLYSNYDYFNSKFFLNKGSSDSSIHIYQELVNIAIVLKAYQNGITIFNQLPTELITYILAYVVTDTIHPAYRIPLINLLIINFNSPQQSDQSTTDTDIISDVKQRSNATKIQDHIKKVLSSFGKKQKPIMPDIKTEEPAKNNKKNLGYYGTSESREELRTKLFGSKADKSRILPCTASYLFGFQQQFFRPTFQDLDEDLIQIKHTTFADIEAILRTPKEAWTHIQSHKIYLFTEVLFLQNKDKKDLLDDSFCLRAAAIRLQGDDSLLYLTFINKNNKDKFLASNCSYILNILEEKLHLHLSHVYRYRKYH